MYLFSIHKNQTRFDYAKNNTLKHVFKPIFFLSLSSIMEHAHEEQKEEENLYSITQYFEVTEHEQSAKTRLKKCKITVKKYLAKLCQKGGVGASKTD